MSKQGTLTKFFKASIKREGCPLSSISKKGKDNSVLCSSPDSKKLIENHSPKNCNGTPQSEISLKEVEGLTPKKKTPYEKRMKLIALTKTYPIISKNIGLTWYTALSSEFRKNYFSELNEFVFKEKAKSDVYPPLEKIWTWTQACTVDEVKVVILGQDPYHNPGQAHGLCFSVQIGVPIPPSLVNMYKELEGDIEGFVRPKHGYLIGWARQGVLLLNAVLTVTKNSANSHKDVGWENLTTSVIKYLNDHCSGIVFLLWGSYAQKKADFVDQKKHCVLKSAHPSPLSANRGFFGCRHFSRCNLYLESIGKTPIDWTNLPVN